MKWLIRLAPLALLAACAQDALPFVAGPEWPDAIENPDGGPPPDISTNRPDGLPIAWDIAVPRTDIVMWMNPDIDFRPPPDIAAPPIDLAVPPDLILQPVDLFTFDQLVPPDLVVIPDLAMNACHAGLYTGQWSGMVQQFKIAGTINFVLAPPQNQILTVQTGNFVGTGPFNSTLTATITGALDCANLTFTGALQNGIVVVANNKIPWSGALTSSYLLGPQSFPDGIWTFQSMGGGFGNLAGKGTWTAK